MATSITLRQLEYFVAVARAGTMAGAAGALHVSPAAVSLGIAELERTLGGELFRRVAHQPLVLSSTGQDLLAGATTIVSDAREPWNSGSTNARRSPACCTWGASRRDARPVRCAAPAWCRRLRRPTRTFASR